MTVPVEKATIPVSIVDDPQRYHRLAELYNGFLAVRQRLESLNVGLDTISSLLEHPETVKENEAVVLGFLQGTIQLIEKQMNEIGKKTKTQ